jgi:uncharacterized protein
LLLILSAKGNEVTSSQSAKSSRDNAATPRQIRELCDQIARQFKPDKIVLFRSHASGQARWDSDVDLLVIMPFKGRAARQATKIRSSIDTTLAVDLLVRTPDQISERLMMGDFFISEILQRGKVIYEAHHERMG